MLSVRGAVDHGQFNNKSFRLAMSAARNGHGRIDEVLGRHFVQTAKTAGLGPKVVQDVLAYKSFPSQHRTKRHSTNPLERLNGEIKRRTEVVGVILLEQNDEWAVQRARYMTLESVSQLSDDPLAPLPRMAA